jgi:carbamoyltransferase
MAWSGEMSYIAVDRSSREEADVIILGWHGGLLSEAQQRQAQSYNVDLAGHDAAAVVLRDGQIVAAIEEERLTRIKHTFAFPARALRFCLESAGIGLESVDAIATGISERFVDAWLLRRAVVDHVPCELNAREQINALFRGEFGIDVRDRLRFCKHHLAHLYACWHSSGFREALCLCLDASGDGSSGIVAHCYPGGMKTLRYLSLQQSLGLFYLHCIGFLGYKLFDEYKVMGLAPYGDPAVFRQLFDRAYRLETDGRFELCTDQELLGLVKEAGVRGLLRRPGAAFEQVHRDFAAALQEALERIVLHVAKHFQRVTGARDLCLSGGVAHNCSMNGRLLRSTLFDRVYVQPAAHDAGNALGAAVAVLREADIPVAPGLLPHVHLGTDVSDAAVEERLHKWSGIVTFARVADAPTAAAELIAAGEVIGWVQGRSEFGPRALGSRSILADPRPAQNKQIINDMIKKREAYRPFAPSVLCERLRDYFELDPQMPGVPYMTIVLPVREDKRALLGAVTHVDGTARVQSVERAANPRYYALIEAFAARTGVPIVLNTSFNNHAEPIVDSVEDALVCLLTTGIGALVIGDWLVKKVGSVAANPQLLELVPAVAYGCELVYRGSGRQLETLIRQDPGRAIGGREVRLSQECARVLTDDPQSGSIARRCKRLGIDADEVARELYDAWQSRVVKLVPES